MFPGLEYCPDSLLRTDKWYASGKQQVTDLLCRHGVEGASYSARADWRQIKDPGMAEFHPVT